MKKQNQNYQNTSDRFDDDMLYVNWFETTKSNMENKSRSTAPNISKLPGDYGSQETGTYIKVIGANIVEGT